MKFSTKISPKVYSVNVLSGSAFGTDNLTTFSNTAVSVTLNNLSSYDVYVKLNGDSEAVFTLEQNTTLAFNAGDMHITSVDFQKVTQSGAGTATIEIIAGVLE